MVEFRSVLITGCGGDVACSIARIARRASMFQRLAGCDLRSDTNGLEYFDNCYQIVRADDADYFQKLSDIAQRTNADLIVPTSDNELGAFVAAGHISQFDGRAVLMASADAIWTGLDKLQTARFLERNGFPHAWTIEAEGNLPLEYPCILKPRRGQGSKGVGVIASKDGLSGRDLTGMIFQEYLPDDNSEFTSGLYRTGQGDVRHITFKRKLVGGLTGSGIVVVENKITRFLEDLAEALELKGSINVQFRLRSDEPVVFEINPRFSSTVRFRDRLGFSDFRWAVFERSGRTAGPWTQQPAGAHIERSIERIILADGTEC